MSTDGYNLALFRFSLGIVSISLFAFAFNKMRYIRLALSGTQDRTTQNGASTMEIPSRIILVPVPEPTPQPVQPLPPVLPKQLKAPANPVLAVKCASPLQCARNSIPAPTTVQSGKNQHQDDGNNEYRFL